jgi:hypothetical protein
VTTFSAHCEEPEALLDAVTLKVPADPARVRLFHVVLLPVGMKESASFQSKATAFTREHHGIIVRVPVALEPLLDAPEIFACCYEAGWRNTANVAQRGIIGIPWPGRSEDMSGNAKMVDDYLDGARGPCVSLKQTYDVGLIRVAFAKLADDFHKQHATWDHPGYEKRAHLLRDKLAKRAAQPLGHANVPIPASDAKTHQEHQAGPAGPHREAASDGGGHGVEHREPVPGHRPALPGPAPPSERLRLVESIFERLGWPGGKPSACRA